MKCTNLKSWVEWWCCAARRTSRGAGSCPHTAASLHWRHYGSSWPPPLCSPWSPRCPHCALALPRDTQPRIPCGQLGTLGSTAGHWAWVWPGHMTSHHKTESRAVWRLPSLSQTQSPSSARAGWWTPRSSRRRAGPAAPPCAYPALWRGRRAPGGSAGRCPSGSAAESTAGSSESFVARGRRQSLMYLACPRPRRPPPDASPAAVGSSRTGWWKGEGRRRVSEWRPGGQQQKNEDAESPWEASHCLWRKKHTHTHTGRLHNLFVM